MAPGLLAAALSGHVNHDLKPATSFASDYPFPCLLNPETDVEPEVAALAPGTPENEAEEPTVNDDDDDVFEGLDEFVSDLGSLRLSSGLRVEAVGDDGQPLVDYEVHRQHRKDGKETLPLSLPSSYRSNLISEAVIGSLPQGLSDVERASLGATPLGVSPALQRLQASGRSAPGSHAARAALRGCVMAFITAGYSGKRFVFEKAKELGVRCVILDGPENWSATLVKEGLAERYIPIDFAEVDTVFDRCLAALVGMRESIGLDGVTTFNEFAVPLVARLAEMLRLPGNAPKACDLARDKRATRSLMQAAGLPSPKHCLIESDEDIEAAAELVGFPAVIKPIAAAASLGVVRVDSTEQLKEQVAATQKQLAGLYLDEHGHIVQAAEGEAVDAAKAAEVAQYVSKTLMMEEYLDGDEVDCDLVMSDGVCTYGAVTDNWPTIEPYFNETGSNCPSILPVATQRELLDLAVASVQALGFKMGVFHVELKATSRGPRLIEVNARMGGGGVRDINLVVWGVDLVEQQLLSSTGLPAKPAIARRPLQRIAEYSMNAPRTGIMESADFMAPYLGLPETVYARPLVAPGDKVVCVADGMPSWVCELCVAKATVREAIAFVQQAERDILFPIKPLAV
ncbi:hypothetical protein OEZ86_004131 [Tetradesmus obliquus]|nr:hypothetical protein OEZ86_004131 [Tetradesmus obliquus]